VSEKTVIINNSLSVGGKNKKFVLIAGPCALEKEYSAMKVAEFLKNLTEKLGIGYIFKSSFNKGNRTSCNTYQGIGIQEGLPLLQKIKNELDIPVVTDIYETTEIEEVGSIVDIIQIPQMLNRQNILLKETAKYAKKHNKTIHMKKNVDLSPSDMKFVIEKIEREGCDNILLCERGSFYGYGKSIPNLQALIQMRQYGYPIIYDATHSVQNPNSEHGYSGGDRECIPDLIFGAVSVGIDGLFAEVHEDPKHSGCDGATMLSLQEMKDVLAKVVKYEELNLATGRKSWGRE
jgi:2-dehydro-3-deoxyphosphooctonate aldolase (KDO 8-P synthase)